MTNTFNESIIPKIINYLNRVMYEISARDNLGRKLTIKSHEVVDPGNIQIAELINKGETYSYNLFLTIKCTKDDEHLATYQTMLEIPAMIENIFIIEGKYRFPTNSLGMDSQCRIHPNAIVFDEERIVTWNYPDGFRGNEGEFVPTYFKVVCHSLDYNTDLTLDCNEDIFDRYQDLLALTDTQIKKLKVKFDTNDIPDHITVDLIKMMYESGPDKKKDHVVDKIILNVEGDFIRYLHKYDNRRKVVMEISNQWWNNNEIYLTLIQNQIIGYFRAAKSTFIEIPSNVNPLVYDSLKYKIRLPNYTTFNNTFPDIIDPINTPENTSVNLINKLNVCASIENGDTYILCYDFVTGNKVKVLYLDYLTEKVLLSESYDYENKKVIPKIEYRYKLRNHEHKTTDLSDIKYVEPAPDERLSLTTRRIPLINMSDSVRVAMGCAMSEQAIQTEGNEPRLVESGNDDYDVPESVNMVSYNSSVPGEVVEIHEDEIFIKDDLDNVTKVTIPAPIIGAGNAMMTNVPLVKVGDKVVPHQVVTSPKIMRRGKYELGTNANAVYMNYLGYTFEDAVVISESYSKKMTHYTQLVVTKMIHSWDTLREIAKIGKKVTSKDYLVLNDSRSSLDKKKGRSDRVTVTDIVNPKVNKNNLVVPNNVDEGYIVDVLITENPNPRDKAGYQRTIALSDYTKKIIDEYKKDKSVLHDYDSIPEEYKNMKLKEGGFDWAPLDDVAITFLIIAKHPMSVGDKSTNSYGSKGIISLILPDECMPRIDLDDQGNGPIFDIIMNPAAVVSRKNASQLYELMLNKIIIELYEITKDTLAISTDENSCRDIRNMLRKYYGDRFDKMTDKQLISASKSIYNFRMKVGSYAKITYDQVMNWAKELDIKEDSNIYCPDVYIYQSDDGIKACTPEKAKELGITNGKLYELGFVENPVVTGYSYMMKLHKSGRLEAKVTSTDMRSGDPLLGKGAYRSEGQKIGEMEFWQFEAHGITDMLVHNNPDIERGSNLFINQMLLTGLALTGKNGLPFNTEYEYKLKKLKERNQ